MLNAFAGEQQKAYAFAADMSIRKGPTPLDWGLCFGNLNSGMPTQVPREDRSRRLVLCELF